jgi:hypothetical protein
MEDPLRSNKKSLQSNYCIHHQHLQVRQQNHEQIIDTVLQQIDTENKVTENKVTENNVTENSVTENNVTENNVTVNDIDGNVDVTDVIANHVLQTPPPVHKRKKRRTNKNKIASPNNDVPITPSTITPRRSTRKKQWQQNVYNNPSIVPGYALDYLESINKQLDQLFDHHAQETKYNESDQTDNNVNTLEVDLNHLSHQLTFMDRPDTIVESSLLGCKEATAVEHCFNRTAGVAFFMKPCGVIMFFEELFRAESVTHMALIIAHEFMKSKTLLPFVPKIIGYDRGCEMDPIVKRLLSANVLPAEVFGGEVTMLDENEQEQTIIYDSPLYMVDKFHVKGHTKPVCDINHEKCKYQPNLDKFSNISKANSSICEQTFARFTEHKKTVRHMTKHLYWFYIVWLISQMNMLLMD